MNIKCIVHDSLDNPNKNGRIYPKEVMENAIEKYYKDLIIKNRAFVFNQDDFSPEDLSKVVATIENINIEGENVIANINILNNENAKKICSEIEQRKLSLRLRGVGSFETKDNISTINDDYEITSIIITDKPA